MFSAITGVLASRSERNQFFTSAIYPYAYSEALEFNQLPDSGTLWELPEEILQLSSTPISGTLNETIVFQTYNNATAEDMSISSTPISGTLIVTIDYQTYNNAEAEGMSISTTPISGTLI